MRVVTSLNQLEDFLSIIFIA